MSKVPANLTEGSCREAPARSPCALSIRRPAGGTLTSSHPHHSSRRESRFVGERFDEPHRLNPFHLGHGRVLFVQRGSHLVSQSLHVCVSRTSDAESFDRAVGENIVESSANLLELRALQDGRPANLAPGRIQLARRESPRQARFIDFRDLLRRGPRMIGEPLYLIETPHLDLRLLGEGQVVDRLTVCVFQLPNGQRGVVVVLA